LNPEIMEQALRAWARGKMCALCGRPLTEADWQMGHFSGLDANGNCVSAAAMPLRDLPLALQGYRPVCWPCHLTQCLQREPFLLAGDRRGQREELWMGE
jgi:hypothetical protein